MSTHKRGPSDTWSVSTPISKRLRPLSTPGIYRPIFSDTPRTSSAFETFPEPEFNSWITSIKARAKSALRENDDMDAQFQRARQLEEETRVRREAERERIAQYIEEQVRNAKLEKEARLTRLESVGIGGPELTASEEEEEDDENADQSAEEYAESEEADYEDDEEDQIQTQPYFRHTAQNGRYDEGSDEAEHDEEYEELAGRRASHEDEYGDDLADGQDEYYEEDALNEQEEDDYYEEEPTFAGQSPVKDLPFESLVNAAILEDEEEENESRSDENGHVSVEDEYEDVDSEDEQSATSNGVHPPHEQVDQGGDELEEGEEEEDSPLYVQEIIGEEEGSQEESGNESEDERASVPVFEEFEIEAENIEDAEEVHIDNFENGELSMQVKDQIDGSETSQDDRASITREQTIDDQIPDDGQLPDISGIIPEPLGDHSSQPSTTLQEQSGLQDVPSYTQDLPKTTNSMSSPLGLAVDGESDQVEDELLIARVEAGDLATEDAFTTFEEEDPVPSSDDGSDVLVADDLSQMQAQETELLGTGDDNPVEQEPHEDLMPAESSAQIRPESIEDPHAGIGTQEVSASDPNLGDRKVLSPRGANVLDGLLETPEAATRSLQTNWMSETQFEQNLDQITPQDKESAISQAPLGIMDQVVIDQEVNLGNSASVIVQTIAQTQAEPPTESQKTNAESLMDDVLVGDDEHDGKRDMKEIDQSKSISLPSTTEQVDTEMTDIATNNLITEDGLTELLENEAEDELNLFRDVVASPAQKFDLKSRKSTGTDNRRHSITDEVDLFVAGKQEADSGDITTTQDGLARAARVETAILGDVVNPEDETTQIVFKAHHEDLSSDAEEDIRDDHIGEEEYYQTREREGSVQPVPHGYFDGDESDEDADAHAPEAFIAHESGDAYDADARRDWLDKNEKLDIDDVPVYNDEQPGVQLQDVKASPDDIQDEHRIPVVQKSTNIHSDALTEEEMEEEKYHLWKEQITGSEALDPIAEDDQASTHEEQISSIRDTPLRLTTKVRDLGNVAAHAHPVAHYGHEHEHHGHTIESTTEDLHPEVLPAADEHEIEEETARNFDVLTNADQTVESVAEKSTAFEKPMSRAEQAALDSEAAFLKQLNEPEIETLEQAKANVEDEPASSQPSQPTMATRSTRSASAQPEVEKPYKCPIKGCKKSFKNENGLKYHLTIGKCEIGLDALDSTQLSSLKPEDIARQTATALPKPYGCDICDKRYKNKNGLKYHMEHNHQDQA